MAIITNDFFKPLELRDNPLAEDYIKVKPLVHAAKAFAQLTHQSIYIIDYYKRGFAYVSDNPLFLCGESPESVLKQGYLFYINHVPTEDLELLLEANESGFKFYNKLPVRDRLNYTISYDFHLIQQDKDLMLINHKLTPLILDRDSNIWLALCIISLASNDTSGNITIREKGENKIYSYDISIKSWKLRPIVKLTRRQKEILILSGQGLTMYQIADYLCIDITTVKYHKQNLFKKLNVTNISEAILKASNYKLI